MSLNIGLTRAQLSRFRYLHLVVRIRGKESITLELSSYLKSCIPSFEEKLAIRFFLDSILPKLYETNIDGTSFNSPIRVISSLFCDADDETDHGMTAWTIDTLHAVLYESWALGVPEGLIHPDCMMWKRVDVEDADAEGKDATEVERDFEDSAAWSGNDDDQNDQTTCWNSNGDSCYGEGRLEIDNVYDCDDGVNEKEELEEAGTDSDHATETDWAWTEEEAPEGEDHNASVCITWASDDPPACTSCGSDHRDPHGSPCDSSTPTTSQAEDSVSSAGNMADEPTELNESVTALGKEIHELNATLDAFQTEKLEKIIVMLASKISEITSD